jgi:hypothetical protein
MISRIENVRRAISPIELRALLEVYGVTGTDRESLLTLCRRANQQGWWQDEALPDWVATFVALESDAATVRAYASELVPGLLQTERYYRWYMGIAPGTAGGEAEINRRVNVRLTRQARLRDEHPLTYWAILNEAVITRLTGAPVNVAREQLAHLLEVGHLLNVSILVLPFTAGLHPAMEGDFTLMTFEDRQDPDVVYLEYQVGSLVLEDQLRVRRYASIWDHLIAQSRDEGRSLAVIESVLDGLTT